MKLAAWLTGIVMAAATVAAAGFMLAQSGRLPGLDFGPGQYYYTDLPDWPRYFSSAGIAGAPPGWVCYALFAAWGGLAYWFWRLVERRTLPVGDGSARPGPASAAPLSPTAPSSAAPSTPAAPFPLFLAPGATALVVGAGRVAARKAETLRSFGLAVATCAPDCFAASAVADFTLVVAATADAAVNRAVYAACRAARVPVNVVDDPALCSFYFGATARKGPLTLAVSGGGRCPVAAQLLRDRAQPLLTDRLAAAAERMGREREAWKSRLPEPGARAAAMRKELERC
ncbi:MAG: bifunctional precorrin-2 dehydrogenase/sirohydrochlorin ferrochelatase [Kiritimatiellia bacterium]